MKNILKKQIVSGKEEMFQKNKTKMIILLFTLFLAVDVILFLVFIFSGWGDNGMSYLASSIFFIIENINSLPLGLFIKNYPFYINDDFHNYFIPLWVLNTLIKTYLVILGYHLLSTYKNNRE